MWCDTLRWTEDTHAHTSVDCRHTSNTETVLCAVRAITCCSFLCGEWRTEPIIDQRHTHEPGNREPATAAPAPDETDRARTGPSCKPPARSTSSGGGANRPGRKPSHTARNGRGGHAPGGPPGVSASRSWRRRACSRMLARTGHLDTATGRQRSEGGELSEGVGLHARCSARPSHTLARRRCR